MARKSTFKSDFNAVALGKEIQLAASKTVGFLSASLQDYIIERFAEEKSGEQYWIRELGKYYTSSAPGEYPAIKLGTLQRSFGVEIRDTVGESTHRMGPRELPGSRTYNITPEPGKTSRRTTVDVPNDPYYASYLEEERLRPYFSRAADETDAKRPSQATDHFVSIFMRSAPP